MEKLYYNRNGYLCDRYPYDIPQTESVGYIEVDNETYNKTLNCHPYKSWAVINGELKIISCGLLTNEDLNNQKLDRIQELKDALTATDYQAIKYAEGLISEAEYQPVKAQRQAWRDEINRLQAELDAL